MKRTLMALILIAGLALSGPALAGETLTLMLDWFPNVDHLPIYVAQQRGFFKAQGVSLDILNPSDTADGLKLAAAGKVDLAVSYEPQTLMAAGSGIDVRVVGRLIGHPLTTLMVLKKSGIVKPSELSGRTIGYTVPGLMDVLMDAFATINGITDYQLVNVGFSIAPALTAGRVDAVMGPFKTLRDRDHGRRGAGHRIFRAGEVGYPGLRRADFYLRPPDTGRQTAGAERLCAGGGPGDRGHWPVSRRGLGRLFQGPA